jgi:hypothetical protein
MEYFVAFCLHSTSQVIQKNCHDIRAVMFSLLSRAASNRFTHVTILTIRIG